MADWGSLRDDSYDGTADSIGSLPNEAGGRMHMRLVTPMSISDVSFTTQPQRPYHETYNIVPAAETPHYEYSSIKNVSAASTPHPPAQFEWMPKATILSSTVNLSNGIVGAGMLALPVATAQVGWLMCIVLFIVCAVICLFTFQLQTSASIMRNTYTRSRTSSYYTLCRETPFPRLALISDAVSVIVTLGVGTSYLVIIGGLMPSVMMGLLGQEINILAQRRLKLDL